MKHHEDNIFKGFALVFHSTLFRLSTWLVTQKTVWCPTTNTNACLSSALSLETGRATWRDSWQERVCVNHYLLCILYMLSVKYHFKSSLQWCLDPGMIMWTTGGRKNRLILISTSCSMKICTRYWSQKPMLLCLHGHEVLMSMLMFRVNVWLVFPQNTRGEIEKLSSFLGLSSSPEEMERIIDLVQFDKMKTNIKVNLSGCVWMNFNVSSFIRKGTVKSKVYN